MLIEVWFAIVGALFVFLAVTYTILERLPLSTAMIYLGLGAVMAAVGYIVIPPVQMSAFLERATEVAVIVSLFTAGLKLRIPLTDRRWTSPLRLALLSMTLTVGAVTLVGTFLLDLPLGAAVLLGAVLAPTDPVLAADVQVHDPGDQDRLRFSLTGEAGFNDGTAFPFVMLGLGLLGLHEIGEWGWRWFAIDLVWAVVGGLAIGGLLGTAVGRVILYMRKHHEEAVGVDDFLCLGLIALSYGLALLAYSYGFLAVFAAGLALRHIEQAAGDPAPEDVQEAAAAVGEDAEIATDPELAEAHMTRAVLGFNEQLERILVVGVVLLLGAMIWEHGLAGEAWWFAPLLFLVIRPLATTLGLIGTDVSRAQRGFIAWFGIRGVGSIYYLMYAIEHGLEPELANELTALVLAVIAFSIVVHGISVTPLMRLYGRRVEE